jgi:2-polyprenyl-3-methyl-5-hydroxy-6-metoxy-1,4-benzoquinol methylase
MNVRAPARESAALGHRRFVHDSIAAAGLLPLAHRVKRAWLRVADQRQLAENDGERVVFRWLERRGDLGGLTGKRILEIGPKHGLDSRLLAGLEPAELVLVDLPEKTPQVRTWLPEVEERCTVRFEEANLLYLSESERETLGTFDLVWCAGVVYHNVEQLRLLRRLFDLCADGGRAVVESSTARSRWVRGRNAVELHWPRPFNGVPTVTHLPSRLAVRSWLEMVGFVDVEICDVYSRAVARNRTVVVGRRAFGSEGYSSYEASGLNPVYRAGAAA